ncbi:MULTISPECIES: VanZ family protein [Halorussus]|uniref:VanZ family protein n=1 Tax=Halorussus TaxID=1070314 RepID=UPI000E213A2E|nr:MULTISPECIES: VanZ family protein [Halorussus]NHN59954.1 VanZ family protein [Halorussus sp. JP-T4]
MVLADVRPPRWLRWATVVLIAGGILYASVLDSPSSGLPALGPLGLVEIDKWLHALAYAALAGSLAVALAPGRSPAVVAGVAALLAVGYGVGVEFVQAPLAARHFSVADMVADAVGAGIAVLGYRVLVGLMGGSRTESRPESDV